MAELPQKKKKQSQGDMCNITEVLIQTAKIKRWLGKEWSKEMHPWKSCLFKLTRTFLYLQHKQHVLSFLIMAHWIFLKCMAQRFVRLLFNFSYSFVFMISVYYDVNLFKLFLYVSIYFWLLIGGRIQSHQYVGGTPTHGGY